MKERTRKIGIVAAAVVVLVALFQTIWPFYYTSLVGMNRYPTAEYFRVMGLLSPAGFSVITIILGCILIAWVAYIWR